MIRVFVLLAFVLVCLNTYATEPSNKDFANKISKCVDRVYANNDQYDNYKRIPVELVIAMSAHESAWGKSRFAIEGNNLFGIRTWDLENVPHLKAKGRPDANWGVKKYKSWCHSVEDYIQILHNHPAYERFREELDFQYDYLGKAEAITLVPYIEAWSEQGPLYVRLVQDILKSLYQQDFFKKNS